MRTTCVLIVALVAFVAGATSMSAATGWHVFATGSDSSQFGGFAIANADVLSPKTLAVRATLPADVSWNVTCEGEVKHATANQTILVSIGGATKCSLDGDANTDTAGTIRLQLLRG